MLRVFGAFDTVPSAEFSMLFSCKKGVSSAGWAAVVSDLDHTFDRRIAVTNLVTSDSRIEMPKVPGPIFVMIFASELILLLTVQTYVYIDVDSDFKF